MVCQHQGIWRNETVTALKIWSDFSFARALPQQDLTPLEPGTPPTQKLTLFWFSSPVLSPKSHPPATQTAKMGTSCVSPGLISRCAVESYRSIIWAPCLGLITNTTHVVFKAWKSPLAPCGGSWGSSVEQHGWRRPHHDIRNSTRFCRGLKWMPSLCLPPCN